MVAAASSISRLADAIAEEEMLLDSGPLGSGSRLAVLKYCRSDMISVSDGQLEGSGNGTSSRFKKKRRSTVW